MKRVLVRFLLLLTFVLLGLVALVLLRAEPAGTGAPDPALLIRLPDGRVQPLARVIELAREGQPLLPPAGAPPAPDGAPAAGSGVFALAELALAEGRLDEALALYLSVPGDDPHYATAQRRLGWNVVSVGRRQPRRALGFVHSALAAAPLDNDVWEDVVRVYVANLGLDTSGWN